jgi:hypothetical protein
MTIWVPRYLTNDGESFLGVGHFPTRSKCMEFARHIASKPCSRIVNYKAMKFTLEPETHVVAWPKTGSLIGELIGGHDE